MATTQVTVRKADILPAPMLTLLQSLVPDCNALLPADITTEQFRAALWLELTGRPSLRECAIDTIRTAIVQAATDGMLPGRDCHILPFRQKGASGRRATKVDNYHGLQRALERTGKVVRSWAAPVCEHDLWEFDRFMDRPKHIEAMTLGKTPGQELFYYGAILFKDGTCAFETMSLDALAAVEASSPAHEFGPWKDWPEMMKRKSALKRVCKYAPVTPEIVRILDADDQRLHQDIPPERHQKNMTDLFGNNTRGSTPDASVIDAEEVEDVDVPLQTTQDAERATGYPDANQAPSYVPAWRDTLDAHKDDSRLTDALRSKIKLALNPASNTTDAKGFELASAVLDVLDEAKKRAGEGD